MCLPGLIPLLFFHGSPTKCLEGLSLKFGVCQTLCSKVRRTIFFNFSGRLVTIRVQYPMNTNLATSPKSLKLKLLNLYSDDDLLAQHIKDWNIIRQVTSVHSVQSSSKRIVHSIIRASWPQSMKAAGSNLHIRLFTRYMKHLKTHKRIQMTNIPNNIRTKYIFWKEKSI